jgi:hypothetical protein
MVPRTTSSGQQCPGVSREPRTPAAGPRGNICQQEKPRGHPVSLVQRDGWGDGGDRGCSPEVGSLAICAMKLATPKFNPISNWAGTMFAAPLIEVLWPGPTITCWAKPAPSGTTIHRLPANNVNARNSSARDAITNRLGRAADRLTGIRPPSDYFLLPRIRTNQSADSGSLVHRRPPGRHGKESSDACGIFIY